MVSSFPKMKNVFRALIVAPAAAPRVMLCTGFIVDCERFDINKNERSELCFEANKAYDELIEKRWDEVVAQLRDAHAAGRDYVKIYVPDHNRYDSVLFDIWNERLAEHDLRVEVWHDMGVLLTWHQQGVNITKALFFSTKSPADGFGDLSAGERVPLNSQLPEALRLPQEASLVQRLNDKYLVAHKAKAAREKAEHEAKLADIDHKAEVAYEETISSRWDDFVRDLEEAADKGFDGLGVGIHLGLVWATDKDFSDALTRIWNEKLSEHGLYVHVVNYQNYVCWR
jgi:hypothetical protein